MDLSYLLTPFLAWLVAGVAKFSVNSIRSRQLAFSLIGYGGFPSNHSAIVSSTVALVAFNEGITHPTFGVALTLAFIVILDANSLRGQVGKHAKIINSLAPASCPHKPLRERVGHTRVEIVAGVVVGIVVAAVVSLIAP